VVDQGGVVSLVVVEYDDGPVNPDSEFIEKVLLLWRQWRLGAYVDDAFGRIFAEYQVAPIHAFQQHFGQDEHAIVYTGVGVIEVTDVVHDHNALAMFQRVNTLDYGFNVLGSIPVFLD
jgi:hypothetical protein